MSRLGNNLGEYFDTLEGGGELLLLHNNWHEFIGMLINMRGQDH